MADERKGGDVKGVAAINFGIRRIFAENNVYIYRTKSPTLWQNTFTNTTTGQILPGGKRT